MQCQDLCSGFCCAYETSHRFESGNICKVESMKKFLQILLDFIHAELVYKTVIMCLDDLLPLQNIT